MLRLNYQQQRQAGLQSCSCHPCISLLEQRSDSSSEWRRRELLLLLHSQAFRFCPVGKFGSPRLCPCSSIPFGSAVLRPPKAYAEQGAAHPSQTWKAEGTASPPVHCSKGINHPIQKQRRCKPGLQTMRCKLSPRISHINNRTRENIYHIA